MSEERASVESLKRGIVEAHLRFVKRNATPMALLRIALNPSDGSAQRMVEAIALLQEQTDFPALLRCDDGTLLTFVKQLPLHQCVQTVKNIQERLLSECETAISCGALTMIDEEDDYERLTSRLERYMRRAEAIGGGKICYGTARYDFCTEGGEEEIFANFFEAHDRVSLYNFYNGMPLSEEVKVLSYRGGVLKIKTSLARAAFLKNEPFTFLKHPMLPDTIKADIVSAAPNRAEVVLTNLRFIDKSPVDRENIRVMPDEKIEVTIECADEEAFSGTIHSLAVNSIAVKVDDPGVADLCFGTENRHAVLAFDLPEREKRTVPIRLSAVLRGKNEDQLIFSIYPNHFMKQKIESYIALQQTRLITIMQKMVLNFYQG